MMMMMTVVVVVEEFRSLVQHAQRAHFRKGMSACYFGSQCENFELFDTSQDNPRDLYSQVLVLLTSELGPTIMLNSVEHHPSLQIISWSNCKLNASQRNLHTPFAWWESEIHGQCWHCCMGFGSVTTNKVSFGRYGATTWSICACMRTYCIVNI